MDNIESKKIEDKINRLVSEMGDIISTLRKQIVILEQVDMELYVASDQSDSELVFWDTRP
jgi:hypothetical protein